MSGLQNYDLIRNWQRAVWGHHEHMRLWTITVPQVKFSIQTGAFLGLHHIARRGCDFDAGLGGDNATITRRMFNSLRDQLDPTIAAISTCLIVVSVAALIGVQLIGRRRM